MPAEQNCPAGHTFPHAPQLFVSTERLKHPIAPHEVCPVGHTHTPRVQFWPGLHARPHPPQWLKSACRSRHPAPEHDVRLVGHMHMLDTHD